MALSLRKHAVTARAATLAFRMMPTEPLTVTTYLAIAAADPQVFYPSDTPAVAALINPLETPSIAAERTPYLYPATDTQPPKDKYDARRCPHFLDTRAAVHNYWSAATSVASYLLGEPSGGQTPSGDPLLNSPFSLPSLVRSGWLHRLCALGPDALVRGRIGAWARRARFHLESPAPGSYVNPETRVAPAVPTPVAQRHQLPGILQPWLAALQGVALSATGVGPQPFVPTWEQDKGVAASDDRLFEPLRWWHLPSRALIPRVDLGVHSSPGNAVATRGEVATSLGPGGLPSFYERPEPFFCPTNHESHYTSATSTPTTKLAGTYLEAGLDWLFILRNLDGVVRYAMKGHENFLRARRDATDKAMGMGLLQAQTALHELMTLVFTSLVRYIAPTQAACRFVMHPEVWSTLTRNLSGSVVGRLQEALTYVASLPVPKEHLAIVESMMPGAVTDPHTGGSLTAFSIPEVWCAALDKGLTPTGGGVDLTTHMAQLGSPVPDVVVRWLGEGPTLNMLGITKEIILQGADLADQEVYSGSDWASTFPVLSRHIVNALTIHKWLNSARVGVAMVDDSSGQPTLRDDFAEFLTAVAPGLSRPSPASSAPFVSTRPVVEGDGVVVRTPLGLTQNVGATLGHLLQPRVSAQLAIHTGSVPEVMSLDSALLSQGLLRRPTSGTKEPVPAVGSWLIDGNSFMFDSPLADPVVDVNDLLLVPEDVKRTDILQALRLNPIYYRSVVDLVTPTIAELMFQLGLSYEELAHDVVKNPAKYARFGSVVQATAQGANALEPIGTDSAWQPKKVLLVVNADGQAFGAGAAAHVFLPYIATMRELAWMGGRPYTMRNSASTIVWSLPEAHDPAALGEVSAAGVVTQLAAKLGAA